MMDNLPASSFSKKSIRHTKIIELLSTNSAMSNYDLCLALSCSEATIRNDLRELDKAGLITRTRGGASKAAGEKEIPLDSFAIDDRKTMNFAEKNAIADYIVNSGILKPHLSIAIDLGSTCFLFAQKLSELNLPMEVAANSLGIANQIAKNPNLTLVLAGGVYYPAIDAFDTNSSLNLFSNMYFDYYFMGANGISKENGVTCTLQDSENRMPVKRLIAAHSKKLVLLLDHTKINKTYMNGICSIKDVNLIITDNNCSSEERNSFKELGTEVIFAPVK